MNAASVSGIRANKSASRTNLIAAKDRKRLRTGEKIVAFGATGTDQPRMSEQLSSKPVRFLPFIRLVDRLGPRFQIYFALVFNLFLLWMLYSFALSEKTDPSVDGLV